MPTRAERLSAALVFERDVDLRPIGFDLAVVELHVELDNLCDAKIAQALRGALGRYVEHARKASGGPRQARGPRKRVDTSAVREWARAQGKEISDRGRIPASVMKEYQAAQGS